MAIQKDMKDIQHFIWDMDGTLFDTYPAIIADLRSALAEFGQDCDPVEAMGLMLVNLRNATRFYGEKFGIDPEELLEVYFSYHNKTISDFSAKPMAGAEEVLKHIQQSGRYNYIFTHRKDWEAVEYLKKYGMDGYFRDLVGQDSPQFAWKPAPDAVLYLMEKYGMTASDTVMVGDRDCDLASGRDAGVRTVHFLCEAVPEELECDWKFTDLRQIVELV